MRIIRLCLEISLFHKYGFMVLIKTKLLMLKVHVMVFVIIVVLMHMKYGQVIIGHRRRCMAF